MVGKNDTVPLHEGPLPPEGDLVICFPRIIKELSDLK